MVVVRFAGVTPCSGCLGWVCSGLLLGSVDVWPLFVSALVFCICVTLGGWWELGNYCNSFPPPPYLVIRYVFLLIKKKKILLSMSRAAVFFATKVMQTAKKR